MTSKRSTTSISAAAAAHWLGVTSRTLRRHTAEAELVPDMLAVVTSVVGRLDGQRSARARRLRVAVAAGARSDDAV